MAKAKKATRRRNDPDGYNPRGSHDPKKVADQDRADAAIIAEAKRLGFKNDSFGPGVTKEMRDFVANARASARTSRNGTPMASKSKNNQNAATMDQHKRSAMGYFLQYKKALKNGNRAAAAKAKSEIESRGFHISGGSMKQGSPAAKSAPAPKTTSRKTGNGVQDYINSPGMTKYLRGLPASGKARELAIAGALASSSDDFNGADRATKELARMGWTRNEKEWVYAGGGQSSGAAPGLVRSAGSKKVSAAQARAKAKADREKVRRLRAYEASSNANEAANAKRQADRIEADLKAQRASDSSKQKKATTKSRTRAAQKKTPVAATAAKKAKKNMAAKKAKKAQSKSSGGNKPGMRRFRRADGTYGYVPDNRGGAAVKAAGRKAGPKKAAAKKTTARKAASKSSTSASGVKMRTVTRNGRKYKVPDNRNGAATKGAGGKGGKGSKKAAKKITKVYGKKAPKGARVTGKGTSVSYTKGRTTTTISRTSRSNPMGNIGMMVTLSLGACLGWIIADVADRFVATMAPTGADQSKIAPIDNAMSIAARPDGKRLLVQALIAAIPAALAYYLARKNKTSPALFIGGIAVGAIVKLLADSLATQSLMAKVLPAGKPGEAPTTGDRLYFEYGDAIQAELSKSIEARNAALTKALPAGTVAGHRGNLAGVGEALPTRGSQPRAGLTMPATAPQSFAPVAPVRALASEVGNTLGCGGNGCGSCGSCSSHNQTPMLPPGGYGFVPGLNTPAQPPVSVDRPEGPADAPGGTRTPTGAPNGFTPLRPGLAFQPALPLALLPTPARTNAVIGTEVSRQSMPRSPAAKPRATVGGMIGRSN